MTQGLARQEEALAADEGAIALEPPAVSVANEFVAFWSSLNLAIGLILAIIAAAALGTFVPQGEPAALASLDMNAQLKSLLAALHATNVYHSSWFLFLLGLFFLNLAVCTYVRGWPRLKFWLGPPRELPVAARDRLEEQAALPGVSPAGLAQALKRKGYRVLSVRDGGLIAEKHRVSRLTAITVHFGLFFLLIGGIVAGLMGFKYTFPALPGATIPVRALLTASTSRGALSPQPADFGIRLDRFWITRYATGAVKQYYSTLSVLEDGQVRATRTIHVNEPLEYKGVTFYQTFWGLGALDFTADGGRRDRILLPQQNVSVPVTGYLSQPFALGDRMAVCFTPGAPLPTYILELPAMRLLGQLAGGAPRQVGGHALRLDHLNLAGATPGLALAVDGKPQALALKPTGNAFQVTGNVSRPFQLGGHRIVAVSAPEPAGMPAWLLDVDSLHVLGVLNAGESQAIGADHLRFVAPVYFSGLQTKQDPGIPFIYTGFAFLGLGGLFGMLSHRQIYVTATPDGCRLGGRANRGRYLFRQELARLTAELAATTHKEGNPHA